MGMLLDLALGVADNSDTEAPTAGHAAGSGMPAAIQGVQGSAGAIYAGGYPKPPAAPIAEALGRSCAVLVARAEAKLAKRPEADLAVVVDDELAPGWVLIAVARRERFSCVLQVSPERYDGVRLLELIERHTVH